ncbi:MAG: phosphatidylglycerophosphatase A family protein [Planctomycetota bacterium]
MRAPVKAILSVFGTGFVPGAPGTAASAVAILVHSCIFLALDRGPATAVSAVLALAFAAATVLWGGEAEARHGARDPKWVVSDEAAGQLVAAVGIGGPVGLAVAFAGFRLLDIAKPFPIRRLERLPGGWGILADDLAAGALVAVAMRLAGPLLPLGLLA